MQQAKKKKNMKWLLHAHQQRTAADGKGRNEDRERQSVKKRRQKQNREVSRKIKKCIRDEKELKVTKGEKIGGTQRNEENIKHQVYEETNLHSEDQKHERRNHYSKKRYR